MQYENLITELMFIDRACNLRCQYCTAPLKKTPVKNGVFTLEETGKDVIELDASPEKTLGKRMREHKSRALEIVPTPVLSLIGGELTLINGIADYIQEAAKDYELVILTTNGSRLSKALIEELSQCKNLLLYFSLDGFNYEMNSYRVASENQSRQLLNSLSMCMDMGVKVECEMVLHDRNIEHIREYAEYLLVYAQKGCYVKLMPFPVRWTQGKYSPLGSDMSQLYHLYEEYETYQEVLPPKAYLANLIQVLKNGKRVCKCFAPYFVNGIDNRGRIKSCPCVPVIHTSIQEETQKAKDTLKTVRQEYKERKVVSGFCNTCYEGAWEMLNAYFYGDIKKEELGKMRIGQSKGVIDVLEQIKETVSDDYFFNQKEYIGNC